MHAFCGSLEEATSEPASLKELATELSILTADARRNPPKEIQAEYAAIQAYVKDIDVPNIQGTIEVSIDSLTPTQSSALLDLMKVLCRKLNTDADW